MGRQWRRLAVGGDLARRPQVPRTQRLADADIDRELLASGDSDAGNGAEELVHADLAGARVVERVMVVKNANPATGDIDLIYLPASSKYYEIDESA